MSAVPTTGIVILCSNHLKQDLVSDSLLKNTFEEVIDLLKMRIQNKSISEVSAGMLKRVFDFRLNLTAWLAEEEISLEKYFYDINEDIKSNPPISVFPELKKTVLEVLAIYQNIISLAYKKGATDTFTMVPKGVSVDSRVTYESIYFLTASHPSPQIRYLKQWTDESLKFDIGLIISYLILTGKINLDNKRIEEELTPFLKGTIDRFGAYCFFTGFWNPDENDHTASTNRMKVIADVIKRKNGIKGEIIKDVDDLFDVGLALAMEDVEVERAYIDVEGFLKKLTE